MNGKKHRRPALRRLLIPLLGLGLALPPVGIVRVAAGQVGGPGQQPESRPSVTPELKGRLIEDVRVLGNTTVSTAIIRNLIRTKIGDPFDPASVQEDYQRIFELRKFSNVEAKVEPTRTGGVIVVFEVREQQLIRSILFRGNRALNEQALRNEIDIKEGQAVDTFRIALARAAITNQYREQNYPFAHVDVPGEPLSKNGQVIFNIVEGPQVRIRKIAFIGDKSFDESRLRDQVKTAIWVPIFSPGRYDAEQVDDDIGSLRRFYEGKGFFDVRIGRKLVFSPDQTEMEVDFLIDEGRRYVVDHVSFQKTGGKDESESLRVPTEKLRRNLKLTEGRAYDSETLQRDVKEIVKDYSPLGYIYQPGAVDEDYLRVEPKTVFRREAGRLDLIYQIHEGRPFHLGPIHVKGNHKSQDKLVLREFRNVTPGSLYNSGEVQDALERLKASPYFSNVTVTPIGDSPDYRDLLVEVAENRTASFNIGAGINSNGGLGGNLTFQQSNFDITNPPNDWRDILSEHAFTGAGQGFRATFEPGTIATNASLRFTEPWMFDQPYSFSEEIYLRDRIREHYDDRRVGDRLSLGKRFDYVYSGQLALRAERVKITGIEDPKYRSEQILAEQGEHLLTSVGFQLRRDTTNPGFFPYKGTVTTAGWEVYGALGGDYSFQKFTLNWDGYRTVYEDLIDRRTVLGLHASGGYIAGDSVFFERFYGGGLGSVRGFRFRGISPRDGRGKDPIGGDFSVTGSAELNFPVYGENLRAVVFTDVGDIESEFRFGTIRTSVGAGMRVILPFLGQTPLAIDFAVPLTLGRDDDRQFISFSFGFSQ